MYLALALSLSLGAALQGSAAAQSGPAGASRSEFLDEAERLNEEVVQLYGRGQYEVALPMARQALELRKKALGSEHPEVAESLNNLAELHRARGDYKRALPLLERALAIRETALGIDHPDVAISLDNLAGLHRDKGDYEKALPLFERALAIFEKTLDQDHPNVAIALDNLAGLHQDKGDYERALSLFERALAIFEKALGPKHPDVAASLNNIAKLHQDKGDYERALPLFERALAIFEEAMGPEHPSVATFLDNLAVLYKANGDYEQALPLFERALIVAETALGEDHPHVAISLNNLAFLRYEKGDYERALPLFERALAIFENALGPGHPSVATSLDNLAVLHKAKGDYERVLPLHQRALTIREKALGPKHPDLATSLNNLAKLHYAKGDHKRALPLFERALAIFEASLDKEHPYVAVSLNNLAELHRITGDYEQALPLYERALAIHEKVLGKKHPDVAHSLMNLAVLHWAWGDDALAVSRLERALAVREAHIDQILAADSARGRRLFLEQFMGDLDTAITFALDRPSVQTRRLAMATLLARKGRGLDSASGAFATVRQRLGPAEQRLLDGYRANRTIYARQLLRGPGSIARAQHNQNLAALEARGHDLERRIAARSVEFRSRLQPVTVAAVQGALPADSVLVEWVRYRSFDSRASRKDRFGAARYAAAVLSPAGEPVWLDLGEAAAIDAAVEVWREALANFLDLAHTTQAARDLDALVMAPVRAHLGDASRVYLAPDGQLSLVPFAALVDERGQYLVESYPFTYLTSGRDLIRLGDPHVAPSPRSPALIVAAPRYTLPGQRERQPFTPLLQVMAEARVVQDLLRDARLVADLDASEAVLQYAKGPTVLHIATHGYFQPITCGESDARASDPMLQSGLALAGANGCRGPSEESTALGDPTADQGPGDGLLTALETAALDLYGTELAVLSACDTGLGDAVGRSDGLYGLRRALVLAGARTQMISLWVANDVTTRQLMTDFYRNLAAGLDRTEALRQVQLDMLRASDGDLRSAHPHFWANFILSGSDAPLTAPFTAVARQSSPIRGPRGCTCDLSDPGAGAPGVDLWFLVLLSALITRGLRRRFAPAYPTGNRPPCRSRTDIK